MKNNLKKSKMVFANNKNINNKDAFTLIELLAIIVILAIIAVITVPIILNIIENSKKGAATDSAYGYKDAVNKWYVQELAKPNNENLKLNGPYTVESDGKLNGKFEGDESQTKSVTVDISGTVPTGGTLTYSNNVLTSGCLVFGDYAVTFDGNTTSTVKGSCSSNQGGSIAYRYKYTYLDDNYVETVIEANEPNSSWEIYVQEDLLSETNEKKVCGKFTNGTVCYNRNDYNSSPLDNSGTKSLALKSNFVTAIGNDSACKFTDNFGMDCQDNRVSCFAGDSKLSYYCSVKIGEYIFYRCDIDENNDSYCGEW